MEKQACESAIVPDSKDIKQTSSTAALLQQQKRRKKKIGVEIGWKSFALTVVKLICKREEKEEEAEETDSVQSWKLEVEALITRCHDARVVSDITFVEKDWNALNFFLFVIDLNITILPHGIQF